MRTLILSCNTGAGHNSCAKAIQEVYQRRGDVCDIYDALLFISKRASKFISNWHTRIYLHAPKIFSSGYEKAEEKDEPVPRGNARLQIHYLRCRPHVRLYCLRRL